MTDTFYEKIVYKHLNLGTEELQGSTKVTGGCINEAARLTCSSNTYFIKWSANQPIDMFATEAEGLVQLSLRSEFKVPQVLGYGSLANRSYLLLEWIEGGLKTNAFWEDFGMKLASLHRQSSTHFGSEDGNYIGRLVQSNKQHRDWCDFFVSERLEPQLRLAQNKGLVDSQTCKNFELLYSKLDRLVPKENPSLLHGDLWSGNFMCSKEAEPVLIDPAVHFGHRETELAFTLLFGGFEARFYECYQRSFPLEVGFRKRADIHNLYPLLVHLNLFGNAYLSGILQTLKRFV